MRAARWAGLACGAALCAAACTGPTPAPPPGAAPVLFVHGYGTSAAVFDDMIAHLEARGYPPSHLKAVELDPNDGSNLDAATRELTPAVEELVAATGGDPAAKIDIVAHSMGALSSRWYATKLRPERVRTLLTIAGANHGTDQLCGQGTAGSVDLCPAFATADPHTVQVGLNGHRDQPADETPYSPAPDRPGVPPIPADATRAIRYVAVSVPDDQWIRPAASSALAGASPVPVLPADVAVTQTAPGNLMFSEPTDHDRILEDERFFVLLDALLFGSGGV